MPFSSSLSCTLKTSMRTKPIKTNGCLRYLAILPKLESSASIIINAYEVNAVPCRLQKPDGWWPVFCFYDVFNNNMDHFIPIISYSMSSNSAGFQVGAGGRQYSSRSITTRAAAMLGPAKPVAIIKEKRRAKTGFCTPKMLWIYGSCVLRVTLRPLYAPGQSH